MTDKRWNALGESLVNYSLNIQPGEKLMIAMYEVETYPLAVAVYGACIRAGGFPQIQFMSETLKHKVLQYGNDAHISWIPEIEAYGMEWADCYIALRGAFNLNECFDIPAEKLARYQKAMGVISSLRWQKTRWALVRVPNERFAQQANVSYERIMDMFFDACNLDWPKEIARWRRIAGELDKGSRLRLVGRGTDLSFSFDGNPWEVSENKGNIPDGEIMVTPKWATVNGKIFFEFPATLGGKVIHNLSITFENGLAASVEADGHLDYVNHILNSDEGARRVGEFAFGTNPCVDLCTTDILIDEKMAGTIHIALGRPYDGSYTSSIHWDIIKDTRTDSQIYIDDRLVFENGRFLV